MTMVTIDESGMTFGPYPDEHCFYIEKSAAYLKIQDGVQMAEFLLMRHQAGQPPAVWVIEAKSSSPRPETVPNFDEFIAEIRAKLTNGLTLGIASILLRHASAGPELPVPFTQLNLANAGFRLVLVIKGHQESWLVPLQDALKKALHATIKTWGLSATAVAVINDSMARQYGIIT